MLVADIEVLDRQRALVGVVAGVMDDDAVVVPVWLERASWRSGAPGRATRDVEGACDRVLDTAPGRALVCIGISHRRPSRAGFAGAEF